MSAPEIDSSKWTGVSYSEEGHDWLPEEISPRMQRRARNVDLARYSVFPAAIVLGMLVLSGSWGHPILQVFGFTLINSVQILLLLFGIPFFFLLIKYLKHIKKHEKLGSLVKFNKEGVLCRETSQFFRWNEVDYIVAYPQYSSDMLISRGITITLKADNDDAAGSFWSKQESFSWRFDGTDVDFDLLERSAKRWQELAHKKEEARGADAAAVVTAR